MNIREFRAATDAALGESGLEERRLGRLKGWSLPTDEVIRFFVPHAYRRPWGFVLSGFIGIELPALRDWLNVNKPKDEQGIFHTCFAGYNILNEDGLRDFMVEHDQPFAADDWARLMVERLTRIPPKVGELLKIYRSMREELGWLAHPHQKHAWDFLQQWIDDPNPALRVPQMLPTGQIV